MEANRLWVSKHRRASSGDHKSYFHLGECRSGGLRGVQESLVHHVAALEERRSSISRLHRFERWVALMGQRENYCWVENENEIWQQITFCRLPIPSFCWTFAFFCWDFNSSSLRDAESRRLRSRGIFGFHQMTSWKPLFLVGLNCFVCFAIKFYDVNNFDASGDWSITANDIKAFTNIFFSSTHYFLWA